MAENKSEKTNFKELSISNPKTGRDASMVGGIIELKYYESILQDNVVIDLSYADTSGTVDNKSALDGLPIERECNVQV